MRPKVGPKPLRDDAGPNVVAGHTLTIMGSMLVLLAAISLGVTAYGHPIYGWYSFNAALLLAGAILVFVGDFHYRQAAARRREREERGEAE